MCFMSNFISLCNDLCISISSAGIWLWSMTPKMDSCMNWKPKYTYSYRLQGWPCTPSNGNKMCTFSLFSLSVLSDQYSFFSHSLIRLFDRLLILFINYRSAANAVEFLPEWSEGHLTLARCQLQLGELELAIVSFKEALRLEVNGKLVLWHSNILYTHTIYKSMLTYTMVLLN